MAYKQRKQKHNWRSRLTADETAVVREYELLTQRAAKLRGQVKLISNRAIQRCRYEGRK